MSTSNPSPATAKPAAKPRNPVERMLVRGFIVVMFVLIAVEGWSKYGHYHAITKLQAMTKAVDEKNAPPVTEKDVLEVMGGKKPVTEDLHGKPGSNGAGRLDIYSWFTVSPIDSREIYVFYGLKGKADEGPAEVLSVQSKRDMADEPLKAPPVAATNGGGAPAGMPGMGAPGMGARGSPRGAAGRPGRGAPPSGGKEGEESGAATPDSKNPPDEEPADEKSPDEKSPDEKPADEKPAKPGDEKDSQ